MFLWNEEKVRFMEDAAAWSDYYPRLAALLAGTLGGVRHICDAGCGTGHLALALSAYVPEVTAVDISPQALALLADNCRQQGVENVTIRQGDIHRLAPAEPYDAMVFSFFGRMEDILPLARVQCRGSVVAIMRRDTHHRFSAGQPPVHSGGYYRGMETLRRCGIPFQGQELVLPMGQPFRSLDDARRFFELYRRPEDDTILTDESLLARLVSTGREDFPLYLPQDRRFGLLRWEARDIPDITRTGDRL